MAKQAGYSKQVWVYADWIELGGVTLMGTLTAEQVRGREVFSFSYSKEWLEKGPALILDPDLGLYNGPQYSRDDKSNFGLFLEVNEKKREAIINKITKAVSGWREVAAGMGIARSEMGRIESVFLSD